MEAHLSARTLGFHVTLADAERSRRLDAMRVLGFQEFRHFGGRRAFRFAGHFRIEFGLHLQPLRLKGVVLVQRLLDDLDGLHHFQHPHEEAVPTIPDDRTVGARS